MTDDDEKVLNHVTPSGRDWDAHQRAHFIAKHGLEEGTRIADANLAAKVKRWKPVFEAEKAALGVAYKTRAERDADDKVKRDAEIAARLAELQEQEQRKREEFSAQVAAEVNRILNERNANVRQP